MELHYATASDFALEGNEVAFKAPPCELPEGRGCFVHSRESAKRSHPPLSQGLFLYCAPGRAGWGPVIQLKNGGVRVGRSPDGVVACPKNVLLNFEVAGDYGICATRSAGKRVDDMSMDRISGFAMKT